MVTVERLGQSAVEGDQVVFRFADVDHDRAGVRVWSDLDLGAHLDLQRVEAGWELRLPIPPVDCLEYLFDVGHGLEPDPGNPDIVDGAFGPHSWLAMPAYQPPPWLDLEPVPGERRPMRVDRTPVGRIELVVWEPEGTPDGEPLPMLVAHDGHEIDAFGELTRYVAALVGTGDLPRMRVALATPGPRDERYAANPAYAAALTEHVVPRLLRRYPTRQGLVLSGQSLGGVAALHAAWSSPRTFGGLFLQSGSFFTPELDPQESEYSRFAEVTGFVASLLAARQAAPGAPLVAMTCGSAEENLANNLLMRDHLSDVGMQVAWGEVRQGHTWMCWRDLLHPHLTDLLATVWGA